MTGLLLVVIGRLASIAMSDSVTATAFERLRAAFGRSSPDAAGEEARPRVFDPGLRVLLVAGVAAALVAALYLWWSRPVPQAAPRAVLGSPAAPVRPGPALPARPVAAPSPSSSSSALVVDVVGKVRHPGVVGLPPGARVIDAIKAAGGLRRGAGTGTLNLARRVVDGEQIGVGIDLSASPAPSAPPGLGTVAGTPLDLNTATAAQLDGLPGVGPVLAQRIIDFRTQHGAFRTVDELRDVSGIGPAKFDDLKSLVRV